MLLRSWKHLSLLWCKCYNSKLRRSFIIIGTENICVRLDTKLRWFETFWVQFHKYSDKWLGLATTVAEQSCFWDGLESTCYQFIDNPQILLYALYSTSATYTHKTINAALLQCTNSTARRFYYSWHCKLLRGNLQNQMRHNHFTVKKCTLLITHTHKITLNTDKRWGVAASWCWRRMRERVQICSAYIASLKTGWSTFRN